MKDNRRVLLFCLDGFEPSYARRLIERGHLEFISSLRMYVSKVELAFTAPAWNTIYTGEPPEVHYITDWQVYYKGSFVPAYTTFRRAPAFWNIASQYGARCLVFNAPMTYPAERIRGVMVSGPPLTPDLDNCFFPKKLSKKVDEDFHIRFPRNFDEGIVREAYRNAEMKRDFFLDLASKRRYELLVFGYFFLDYIQHWFRGEEIRKLYEFIDSNLKIITDEIDPDYIILVNDHGGLVKHRKTFFLIPILRKHDLLYLNPPAIKKISMRILGTWNVLEAERSSRRSKPLAGKIAHLIRKINLSKPIRTLLNAFPSISPFQISTEYIDTSRSRVLTTSSGMCLYILRDRDRERVESVLRTIERRFQGLKVRILPRSHGNEEGFRPPDFMIYPEWGKGYETLPFYRPQSHIHTHSNNFVLAIGGSDLPEELASRSMFNQRDVKPLIMRLLGLEHNRGPANNSR